MYPNLNFFRRMHLMRHTKVRTFFNAATSLLRPSSAGLKPIYIALDRFHCYIYVYQGLIYPL